MQFHTSGLRGTCGPYVQIWREQGLDSGIKSEQDMISEVKGQPGLGFSWVSGKLLGMGVFRALKRVHLGQASGMA